MSCCQHVGNGDMTSFTPNSETVHLYVTSPSTPHLRHEAYRDHLCTETKAIQVESQL